MNIEKIALEVANELGWSLESSEKFIACCLSKLAEQDMEPVAWQDTQTGMIYTTVSPAAKHLYSPIYTETQLLAAQQRTAEACAKVIRGEGIGFADDDEELNRIAAMLDAGEWREYL